MKRIPNTDGSVSITLEPKEILKLKEDWKEIERHFDLDTFFDGEENSVRSLVEEVTGKAF